MRMPAPLEALLLAMRAQETSETDEAGGAASAGEEEGGVVVGGGASSVCDGWAFGGVRSFLGEGRKAVAGFDLYFL